MHLSTSSIRGTSVVNMEGESIGNIYDIMLDAEKAIVKYYVLSFGGVLGFNDKYFAIPPSAFTIDTANEQFKLNIEKEQLEDAEGFDKEDWPKNANQDYLSRTMHIQDPRVAILD
ncbi:MAG: PRC-barrel domain-containing protein [Bacteroidota bacterium]